MSKAYVETIPIIKSAPKIKDQIEKLVTEILEIKKQNSTGETLKLETEIDQLVYEIYGLSEEEIVIVERMNKNNS